MLRLPLVTIMPFDPAVAQARRFLPKSRVAEASSSHRHPIELKEPPINPFAPRKPYQESGLAPFELTGRPSYSSAIRSSCRRTVSLVISAAVTASEMRPCSVLVRRQLPRIAMIHVHIRHFHRKLFEPYIPAQRLAQRPRDKGSEYAPSTDPCG